MSLELPNGLLMALNLLLSHGLPLGKCLKYGAVGCISEIHHSQKMSLCDNTRHAFQSKCGVFLTCWETSKSTSTPEIAQATQLVRSNVGHPA